MEPIMKNRPSWFEIMFNKYSWILKIEEMKEIFEKFELEKRPKLYSNNFYKIFLDNRKSLITNDTRFNQRTHNASLNEYIKFGFYEQNFDEITMIGLGSFSLVFSAKNKLDDKTYAIKKIPIKFKFNSLESFFLSLEKIGNLRNDFLVSYEKIWAEENHIQNDHYKKGLRENFNINENHVVKPNLPFLIHIQMELCIETLQNVINNLKNFNGQKNRNVLNMVGFSVASELSFEILECLNYLHNQLTPIVHCDIKPTNIMITNGKNGKLIKLSDLGLSKVHKVKDVTIRSNYKNTLEFIAPEVLLMKTTTVKSDIYSVGRIMEKLFNLDTSE
jgi:serine/threonine protein kinase